MNAHPTPHTTPTEAQRETIRSLMAAVNEAVAEAGLEIETPTRYNNPHLPSHHDGTQIGDTPPVQQPGTPPMSQQATDIARAAMFCGLATVPPGLIAIGMILASEHANPTVIGMICAAPAAIAVPILAVARLMRRTGEAAAAAPAPAEIHNHGPVHQNQTNTYTTNRGVWVKNSSKP